MLVYSFHTCLLNSCSEPGSVLSEQNGGWAEAELVPVSTGWTGSGERSHRALAGNGGRGCLCSGWEGLICHLKGEGLIGVAGGRHSLSKGPVAGRGRGLMRNSQKATEAVGRPGRGMGRQSPAAVKVGSLGSPGELSLVSRYLGTPVKGFG